MAWIPAAQAVGEQEHIYVVGYYLPDDELGTKLVANNSDYGPILPHTAVVFSNNFNTVTFNAFDNTDSYSEFDGLKVKYWLAKYGSPVSAGESYDQSEYIVGSDSNSYLWQYSSVANSTLFVSYLAARLDYIEYEYQLVSEGEVLGGETELSYADSVVLSSPAKRTGYDFVAWQLADGTMLYAGQSYTGADLGLKKVHTDGEVVTLTAKWSEQPKAHLVPLGGTVSSEYVYAKQGQTYGTLPTPQRTGYGFVNWYTDAVAGTPVTASTVVTTNLSHYLFARWTNNLYQVTFNPQSGSVSPSSKLVPYHYTYGALPTPTYAGYSFSGWSQYPQGTELVESTNMVTIAANHTLYALWGEKLCQVTFVYLDGNGNSTNDVQTVKYGASAVEPTAHKTYTEQVFTGWSRTFAYITADTTITAQYRNKKFTIKFDGNDTGKYEPAVSGSTAAQSMESSSSQVTLNANRYSLEGYDFLGWSRTASATAIEFEDGEWVRGNEICREDGGVVTFYAIWKAKNYTVTFDYQGGSESVEELAVTYDAPYPQLPVTERDRYEFAGWYSTKGLLINSATIVKTAADHTLTAKWNPQLYYYTNTVDEVESAQPYYTVSATNGDYFVNYLPPTPTRTGYTFTNWYYMAQGKPQMITGTTKVSDPCELFASWTTNSYKVTLDCNGGTFWGTVDSTVDWDVKYNTKYWLGQKNPHAGSQCTGMPSVMPLGGSWYIKDTDIKVDNDTLMTTAEDHTLEMRWPQND